MFVRQVCFKELKIKLILPNLKHGAHRSHSEACSLKKCTLPYIYFVFKCLVLYFGIKKEWLEKSLNTFSLAANILKGEYITWTCFSDGFVHSFQIIDPYYYQTSVSNLRICNIMYSFAGATKSNIMIVHFFLEPY